MKITIDIDCTPQEARAFFGLPDVEPIQEAVLGKVQDRLTGYLEGTDPEALLKLWLPGGLQGLSAFREGHDLGDLASSQRHHLPPAALDRGFTSAQVAPLKDCHDHPVAGVDDLRGLDRELVE